MSGRFVYVLRQALPTGVAAHDFFGAIDDAGLRPAGTTRAGAMHAAEQLARRSTRRVEVLRRPVSPLDGAPVCWQHVSTVWIGPQGGAHGIDR